MGYVSTWMGDRLNSRPGMGYTGLRICFCNQTFINSTAILESLMALALTQVDQKTF